jgi:type VI secretion system FHA domain protein
MPNTAVPNAPPPAVSAGTGALMAAFLHGADMDGTEVGDPLAKMTALGAAFRAMVGGLRQVLIARAAIKGEFRIEQTMIRARGNNPLKFSTGDDDALAALLGTGRRSEMAPQAAVADALTDIRLHELATMAAMQSAVRALLARFDPAALRTASTAQGGITLPGQAKSRAWDEFERQHAATTQALTDDFDSVFGKVFARAYEQALDDVTAKEKRA